MFKKMPVLLAAAIFCFSSNVAADSNYDDEIAQLKEKMETLLAEIGKVKSDISKIQEEYITSDKDLRRGLLEEKKIAQKEGDKALEKKIVARAKERQKEQRKLYYKKKNPLKRRMNQLKVQYAKARQRIRQLSKKIDKIKEGKGEDIEYIEQMKALKQQLKDAKATLKEKLAQIKDELDSKLSDLAGSENRAEARKEIISDINAGKLEIYRAYTAKKEEIKAQIDKIKSAHRQRMKVARDIARETAQAEKAASDAESDKEASAIKQNFTP